MCAVEALTGIQTQMISQCICDDSRHSDSRHGDLRVRRLEVCNCFVQMAVVADIATIHQDTKKEDHPRMVAEAMAGEALMVILQHLASAHLTRT
jgi:hypothetical protein